MKLRFTKRALSDLQAIIAHVQADNPAAAQRVGAALRATSDHLITFPHLGHPTDEDGVRELVVARMPCLIYYSMTPQEVIVLHIRHAARRPLAGEPRGRHP